MKNLLNSFRNSRASASAAWNRFWFSPADPATVAVIRIGTGLVLLYMHLWATPELMNFVGPHGWMDSRAIEQIKNLSHEQQGYSHWVNHWWGQSIWLHVQNPMAIWILHGVFLAAIASFTIGLFSRTANIIVWVGHLSYIHRGVFTWFGMDTIVVMLLFYLMFAPTGAAFSVDRLRKSRRGPHSDIQPSWLANLTVRSIQIHMCIVYLCSGLAKLKGARWWDGTAVWQCMQMYEFAPFDMGWLAHGGDTLCLLVSTSGVALTLFVEISFAFLIWNRRWRPVIIALAVLMHAGIALFMGMGSFQAVMLIGDLSFASGEMIRRSARGFQRSSKTPEDAPTLLPFPKKSAKRRAA